jgi:phage replication O-like protein O
MGFTAVDNEFFTLLPLLSGNEVKVLLIIIRNTYGWHKDTTTIKQKEIAKETGINERNVTKHITTLIEKGFMKKTQSDSGLKYKFCINVKTTKTLECYETYTTGNCPFAKTKKEETYCLKCPRYLLSKKFT